MNSTAYQTLALSLSLPARPSPKTASITYSHNHTRHTDIRAQSLADARALPEGPHEVVVLVAVHDAREHVVCVCRGADCEQDYEEEGLEVKEGGLGGGVGLLVLGGLEGDGMGLGRVPLWLSGRGVRGAGGWGGGWSGWDWGAGF